MKLKIIYNFMVYSKIKNSNQMHVDQTKREWKNNWGIDLKFYKS